ncbi:MAG TPA: cytochrome c oxidase subunit 3 [Chthoniobacterales bacterium]|jgi:heme/copper-type cytochrome/quinol oxidase subunit 3
MSAPARTLDVSDLEPHVMDHRSPIWWGNVMLLCIETTMFALLVASYFYIHMNYAAWPPPRPENSNYRTNPDLGFATINLLIILASVVPMAIVDKACLRRDLRTVQRGMLIMVLIGLVTIALRFLEFNALQFRWDDNAYAGIVWTTVGMHLLHLVTGTAENLLMCLWVWIKGMDDKHARDIRVGCVYWYWIAAIWIPLYVIIYFGPRWI